MPRRTELHFAFNLAYYDVRRQCEEHWRLGYRNDIFQMYMMGGEL